jgi:general stress protein 26
MSTPTATLDPRFGDATEPLLWGEVTGLLAGAELYWLTTVRVDGRPHVTPLVGVWHEGAFWFCTGKAEQKTRNLEGTGAVAVTTGCNSWEAGTDVVVEGTAERVTDLATLRAAADAWFDKYGGSWHFTVHPEGGFDSLGQLAHVYRVRPDKVLAFAKDPHGQTTFRFAG